MIKIFEEKPNEKPGTAGVFPLSTQVWTTEGIEIQLNRNQQTTVTRTDDFVDSTSGL